MIDSEAVARNFWGSGALNSCPLGSRITLEITKVLVSGCRKSAQRHPRRGFPNEWHGNRAKCVGIRPLGLLHGKARGKNRGIGFELNCENGIPNCVTRMQKEHDSTENGKRNDNDLRWWAGMSPK